MAKRPQGGSALGAYFATVFGLSVFSSILFKARVQAWYQTMPPEHAKAVGVMILLGLFVVIGAGALIIVRSSNAKRP